MRGAAVDDAALVTIGPWCTFSPWTSVHGPQDNFVAAPDGVARMLAARYDVRLHEVIDGHIAHISNTFQIYPYLEMGAAGIWNHSLWSGPWPVLARPVSSNHGVTPVLSHPSVR